MNFCKNTDGFSLKKDNIGFDFKTAQIPTEKDGFFVLTASGNVPVPEIHACDRLLLPVDEGIAVTADEKYEKGQFDCECIGGSFCSREGTMGMIIVERAKKFLLIAIENTPFLCLIAAAKITVQSRFAKTGGEKLNDNILFNGFMFLTAAIIFLPFLIKNGASVITLLMGAVMGILSVVFQIFYICAFSKGKMALTVIINNFSMLLPTAVSAAFLNENFGLFKVVGTVLALVSLVLSVSPDSTEENLTKKSNNAIWLICTLLVFLSNGFISINQKLYSVFTDKIEVFEFVAAAYLTASFLSAMILTAINIKNHVRASADKKTVISSVIVGVMLGVFQCLNTYSASVLPGTVLYPAYNCGVSVLCATVGAVIFREKLTKKQGIGVAVGIFAIVLLCI